MVRFKNRLLIQGPGNRWALFLYILCECRYGGKKQFTDSEIYSAIVDAIAMLHGDFGIGAVKVSLNVKIYNEETDIVLIRCASDSVHLLTSAIPFVHRIGKADGRLRTIHLAGSIRRCQLALLDHHRKTLKLTLPKVKTLADQQEVLDALRTSKLPDL